MIPEPIKNLIDALKKLPSIGPRQATRMAFYIAREERASVAEFISALAGVQNLRPCSDCFLIHQNSGGLCNICGDPARKADVVAIVEKETDLISIEKAKKFIGKYLILGDLGRGGILEHPQRARLMALKSRLAKLGDGIAEEIILAVNPTVYGDLAAAAIGAELVGVAKKITRLGRGIPTGGEIEFADEETLGQALDGRR